MNKIKGILIMAGICSIAILTLCIGFFVIGLLIFFALQSFNEFLNGDLFGGVKLIILIIVVLVLLYKDI